MNSEKRVAIRPTTPSSSSGCTPARRRAALWASHVAVPELSMAIPSGISPASRNTVRQSTAR